MNPPGHQSKILPQPKAALAEMVRGLAEKKPAKPKGRCSLKSLDAFGTQPQFGWDSKGSYQTKVGSMCTALCMLALGFVAYTYFKDFILCLEPNVSTKTVWGPIEKDAPYNDLNLQFAPAFRAIWYKVIPHPTIPGKTKSTPVYLSSQDLDCHFNVYATVHNHMMFTPEPPVIVPIKQDCDNTWEKWSFLPSMNVTREMIAKFRCFDIPKMPIYGDLPWCNPECQWYTLNIELKKDSDRVSCPVPLVPDNTIINFVGAQSFPNVDDFDKPWKLNESTETVQLSTTLQKRVSFKYQEIKMTTTARQMLFEPMEKVDSRLVYHSSSYDYKTVTANASLSADVLLLTVLYLPTSAQQHTGRSYRTLIDTLSDIGGFSDILLMVVGIFYGFYLDSQLEKDLIHKA
jgi:hypothetical protein